MRLSALSSRSIVAQVTGCMVIAVMLCSGCASNKLAAARANFNLGRFDQAEANIRETTIPEKDRLLLLMESGMIRQNQGNYEASARDWIAAAALVEDIETYSISQGATSLIVNDNVQDYCGFPFERTLLHAFSAKDFLAMGNWDGAAVEGRRIIRSLAPARRGDYPEDAYSRYMAGFCLEMQDDPSNAALQYRNAQKLLKDVTIGEDGRLSSSVLLGATQEAVGQNGADKAELVCFILSGRVPTRQESQHGMWSWNPRIYGEIYHNGKSLGRSYVLADTAELSATSEKADAARRVGKTIARVVVKEQVVSALDKKDTLLGFLARLVLLGIMEAPDLRKWETLPRWLSVARVECPPDLKSFDVVFRNESGGIASSIHVARPITRNGRTFISFCRDIPDVSNTVKGK